MGLKAFDLVPAIERLNLMSDKAQTRVSPAVTVMPACISCNKLYYGNVINAIILTKMTTEYE